MCRVDASLKIWAWDKMQTIIFFKQKSPSTRIYKPDDFVMSCWGWLSHSHLSVMECDASGFIYRVALELCWSAHYKTKDPWEMVTHNTSRIIPSSRWKNDAKKIFVIIRRSAAFQSYSTGGTSVHSSQAVARARNALRHKQTQMCELAFTALLTCSPPPP